MLVGFVLEVGRGAHPPQGAGVVSFRVRRPRHHSLPLHFHLGAPVVFLFGLCKLPING
jgi:hypothetical protein